MTQKKFLRAFLPAIFAFSAGAGAETPVIDCSQLKLVPLKDTVITKVAMQRGAFSTALPNLGPMPEHCLVTGIIEPRNGVVNPDTGSDSYGTRFELRLPIAWNGRFFYEGGGGLDGAISGAVGKVPSQGTHQRPALWRGYAVIGTDGGHHSASILNAGFGMDPQARIDYGYRSIGVATPVAKSLIAAFYGTNPKYSYFLGCSKGGQEAMQASQRYADQFDGIVAGDPGFHLPQAAVNQVSDNQILAATAHAVRPWLTDTNGNPLLWGAFSSSELSAISNAISTACDTLDGFADNLIFQPEACAKKFDPAVLLCKSVKTPSCLRPVQVDALKKVVAGARNHNGDSLYAEFPYDTGFNSKGLAGGWRFWKLGIAGLPVNISMNYSLIADAYRFVFSTPPNPQFDVLKIDLEAFDANTRATGIDSQTGVIYDTSPVGFMYADSVDLDTLRNRGGKLILYHGASDPVFSLFDTLNYYKNLQQHYGKATADFARAYVVPGMGHCSDGSSSTNSFDSLTAIENWVERGIAPDRIVAGPGNATAFVNENTLPATLTRPLCPYPKYARYVGNGDPSSADSFACAAP